MPKTKSTKPRKRKTTHKDVDFAVDDASGSQQIFKSWDKAAAFAMSIAVTTGKAVLDTIVWSEAGARWVGGDDAVTQYREDPEASVFERIEIKANMLGRIA